MYQREEYFENVLLRCTDLVNTFFVIDSVLLFSGRTLYVDKRKAFEQKLNACRSLKLWKSENNSRVYSGSMAKNKCPEIIFLWMNEISLSLLLSRATSKHWQGYSCQSYNINKSPILRMFGSSWDILKIKKNKSLKGCRYVDKYVQKWVTIKLGKLMPLKRMFQL